MAGHKISFWLTTAGELRELSSKAQRLARLQRTFLDSVPPELARAARTSDLRGGTVRFVADNSTVAAKLKQLVPRLLIDFRKSEPEVTGIHISVQVKSSTKRPAPTAEKAALSHETIDEFRRLVTQVRDRRLRSALTRLVRRRIVEP